MMYVFSSCPLASSVAISSGISSYTACMLCTRKRYRKNIFETLNTNSASGSVAKITCGGAKCSGASTIPAVQAIAAIGAARSEHGVSLDVSCAISAQNVGELEAMFEQDFANSRQVSHREIDDRNVFFKLGAAGARLLSPVL